MKYTQSVSRQSLWNVLRNTVVGALALVALFYGVVAHANTPTMTAGWVIGSSNPNLAQISVTGDPYSNVTLNYTRSGYSGIQSLALGQINSSGYYTTTIDNTIYNIAANSSVYVTTTLNGSYPQTSPAILWPIGGTNGGSITFSQSSVSLQTGQTVSVNIYGGNGAYTVTGNSASSVIQASVSGSTLVLSTTSYYTGAFATPNLSSVITVCSNNTTLCGTLTVTINGGNSSALYFSQSNPSVGIGQTTTVTVAGGSVGTYYISSNANSSIANATINGSVITINGVNTGTTSISVCSGSSYGAINLCSTLPITVTYGGNTGGLTLSQTTLSLSLNQTSSVSILGNGISTYYIGSNTTPGVATATLSGNIVTVYAQSGGTTNINICQYSGQCATLYVTVGGGSGPTIGTAFLTFNTPSPVLSINQSTTIYISGGQGIYTIPYNSSSSVVTASTSGNALTLIGRQNGFAVVVACDSYNNCGALNVRVGTGIIINPTGYVFTQRLTLGSTGEDVRQLQIRLTSAGLYTGSVNGIFGTLTQDAVRRYQSAHGLYPDGAVGPMTRATLNSGL